MNKNTLNSDNLEHSFGNIYQGIQKTVSWSDVPFSIAFLLSPSFQNSSFANHILLDPSNFERNLSNKFHGKSYSFGSIDKELLPNILFFGRFAYNLTSNLLGSSTVTSDTYHKLFGFRKSLLYTYVITEYAKNLVNRERPDGSDNRSFFSGHTSTTFAAATYLALELNDVFNEWDLTAKNDGYYYLFQTVSLSTIYGWASYVGYSRIKDSKHYLSDVIVGAAVGSLVSYIIYRNNFDQEKSLINSFTLIPQKENLSLAFRMKL
ncbi:MAG: phosphatase PAP2 family protein [Melioribacteraceae bacterium]|nr:phosphatase PAP2 family protein [Melioribacteraceae bacterium]MCF8264708.1 phosphatase PAP2 family protein [Melioribacteraceae bacterium]